MKNLEKIVNWFCSKISYNELCSAVTILLEYVSNPTLVRLKESKEEFPNYRKFSVDERPPVLITEPNEPVVNYREQLRAYKLRTGKEMKPVSRHKGKPIPPSNCYCHHCEAPVKYLSYNNGKKQTQVRCKVCKGTSMINRKRPASEVVYRCPYCDYKLFRWKQKRDVIIYKRPTTRKAKHTPVEHDLFEELSTAPERWCKLLSLAA